VTNSTVRAFHAEMCSNIKPLPLKIAVTYVLLLSIASIYEELNLYNE